MQKPLLAIVAGPNGSGKTRWTQHLLKDEWLRNCVYINPDEIAQDQFAELGGWNSSEATLRAMQIASDERELCLAQKKSLVFETVFSTDEKVNFVRRAVAAGYFVRFFFIATDSPEINAARVARRVSEGGHTVDITKIIDRYERSMVNATRILSEVDRAYFFDNSIDGESPTRQFRVANGSVARVYSSAQHPWADLIRDSIAFRQQLQERKEPAEKPSKSEPPGPT